MAQEQKDKAGGEKLTGGFSYVVTDRGRAFLEVEGESATGVGSDTVHIEKPRVTWHRDDGVVLIIAEKGVLHRKVNAVHFEGKVEVRGEKWGSLSCSQVDWNGTERKITARGAAKGVFYMERHSEKETGREKTETKS